MRRKPKHTPLEKRVSTDRRGVIRAALKTHPDGLTLRALRHVSGLSLEDIRRTVATLPDVYVDRWAPADVPGGYDAVYVKIDVPEDSPHPTGWREKNAAA